ncbi:MAG TPA: hypothetical protein VK148_22655 [Xanthobacteraceae bacterium]|nr:hypothetical protein [Xanthobacteraceae bacterium]
MTIARRFAASVSASWLIAVASFTLLVSSLDARAQGPAARCEDAAELAVLPSPVAPWKGAPLRIIFAAEKPLEGEFSLIAPNGSVAATSRERHGGPPYFWFAEVAAPAAGTWHATLVRERAPAECSTITREIAVRDREPPRPTATPGSLWPLRNVWSLSTENLYSAWIEKLFDAPLDAAPSWKALHEVLRDKSRNMLFNHLGLREDELGMIIRPDCADLPYFLRAYFSFKMGLPFGYAKCTRGTADSAPKCYEWWNIQNYEDSRQTMAAPAPAPAPVQRPAPEAAAPWEMFRQPVASIPTPPVAKPVGPPPRPPGLAAGFGHFLRYYVADTVHSGSGRTALADNNTDYYPVPLNAENLRPGTTYADPYGHLLVLAKRVAQSGDEAGVFFAVDAQPDGTVARKRFWRGNFLFAQDPGLGGPGFKRFRPIVRDKSGVMHRLTNDEIAKNQYYGDFSLEQGRLPVEAFYDKMDDVMSPAPLDPLRAITEAITSLDEQVKARVTSVENGRKFLISGKGDATMPDGPAIFETTGAWEDFATPSRDLRLLIALDVVRGFPDRVVRRPERYAMPPGKSVAAVKSELEGVLAQELSVRKISYLRSNGSPWTLTLKDVIDRTTDLEMAYNLNDCAELRWGAAEKTEEASTCKRRAPQAQRAKMTNYRAWFHERRRPPRA